MLHLSKGFGSYQPAEQNEMPPSIKKEIILENNTGKFIINSSKNKVGCVLPMVLDSILPHVEIEPNDYQVDSTLFHENDWFYEFETDNDVSSSSEDEDSFHEGTNQTVINGEIDFITSVIEDQLKMSGAKRSETDFIKDETSDISDVS